MAVIDKNMYEKLKKWCDLDREIQPENQQILYVNSRDRALTGATIRKLMYEVDKEDHYGELYFSFYSAESFYHNMREYYSEIAKLYFRHPKEDDPLVDIIESMPATGGWITLIVEDMETLSEDAEKMKEMMETIFSFAVNRSDIILIGDGDYKDVFSGCEFALREMEDGIAANEEQNLVAVGLYDQEPEPVRETVAYETGDDQLDELNFYWRTLYEQLDRKYFDYEDFKTLFRETLEYIIPRVTEEMVYRKDLRLIEHISILGLKTKENVEGCKLWEFEAAQKLTDGLHDAIVDSRGRNDDFSEGEVVIHTMIDERSEDLGAVHISGCFSSSIDLSVDTAPRKMDELSEVIRKCTYQGESTGLRELLYQLEDEKDGKTTPEDIDKLGDKLGSLMEDIKEAADEIANKIPGRKVRRYRGEQSE